MTRKRSNPERTLTNAERCKNYRKKNEDKYRENDTLRKKHQRLMVSVEDPIANKSRLEEQALKKRLQRQRRKMAKETTITIPQEVEESATSSTALDPTTPLTESSTPVTSSFKHKSTKSRSINKANLALPKSPGKKKEVVAKLASDILKVKLPKVNKMNKSGRKRKDLFLEEENWLIHFLDRPDISRQTPGRRDHVYVGKVNGERRYLQKRYLLWTLNELVEIANGSELSEVQSDSFVSSYEKKNTFRQLYSFLKKHKEYKWNRNIPHESCACEICENTRLFIQGFNKKAPYAQRLPLDVNEIVDKFTCEKTIRAKACMVGDCPHCPKVEFDTSIYSSDNSASSNDSSDESESDRESRNVIQYFKWATVDSKIQKISVEIDMQEVEECLQEKVRILKYHLYVKKEQFKKYVDLKTNLEEDEIVIHADFAESYENKQQDEIQSAYFGHTNFSIFTACCYVRNKDSHEVDKHSMAIVSEESDHSRIATHTCILKVIDEVRRMHPNLPYNITVHLWSDGCASQFRSRFVFKLTTLFPENYDVIRYYNERHHGKGPMDGVGGCVKNLTFRAVQSGKIVIQTPEDFAAAANNIVKGISVFYLPLDEVMDEPEEVAETPYVESMCTLQVHMVKCHKTKAGFHYLNFFRVATEEYPFYTHWYRRLGDLTDPCGHFDIEEGYKIEETCASCLCGETGSSWICCPLCKQWYHEECYHK